MPRSSASLLVPFHMQYTCTARLIAKPQDISIERAQTIGDF